MAKQTPPRRYVPDVTQYSLRDHESVMFRRCPNCFTGRVFWGGDGDTRWIKITGIRGACCLCSFEAYTKDLLEARDIERSLAFLGAA